MSESHQVKVRSIDGTQAIVEDSLGRETTVRTDIMRTGMAPAVGETWVIDRSFGEWSFAAKIGTAAGGSIRSAMFLWASGEGDIDLSDGPYQIPWNASGGVFNVRADNVSLPGSIEGLVYDPATDPTQILLPLGRVYALQTVVGVVTSTPPPGGAYVFFSLSPMSYQTAFVNGDHHAWTGYQAAGDPLWSYFETKSNTVSPLIPELVLSLYTPYVPTAYGVVGLTIFDLGAVA